MTSLAKTASTVVQDDEDSKLSPEQLEKKRRFFEYKTKPISDIDDLQSGDLLFVKKDKSIETYVMPFGDPQPIPEDGSLFIATKAKGMLQAYDCVQIIDCIAFKREDKIYPYAVRVLHDSEAVFILFNDFMNTKAIGDTFVQVDTSADGE